MKGGRTLSEQLRALKSVTAPLLPRGGIAEHVQWVQPHLVGVVEYREFTGLPRHPAWKGLVAGDADAVSLRELR